MFLHFRANCRGDMRGKVHEFTPKSELMVFPLVNTNDFECELGNLKFVKEKLAIHLGSAWRRENEGSTLVNQDEQP